jgi:putative hemolysin
MQKAVSIPALMEEKNPRSARRIPAPVFRLLERIAHIREVNGYIRQARNLSPPEALDCALEELDLSFETDDSAADSAGMLPAESRITVVANHPHGGADALILLKLLTDRYGHAVVPANDLVKVISPLSSFFVPVNKHGTNKEYYRQIDSIFTADLPVLVFPAGRTGRPGTGRSGKREILDFPWTKTFLKKSRFHGRTIVPVFIHGRNSRFFYTLAWLRTRLGIRTNIEMFFLVHELMKKRGSSIKIVIGPPVAPSCFDDTRTDQRWAQTLQHYVRSLGNGNRDDFMTWIKRRNP